MNLATDKPRFSISTTESTNKALELYCAKFGESKSQIIEKVLSIILDLSEENLDALIKWAEIEYRSPEDQARLIIETAIINWKNKNRKI